MKFYTKSLLVAAVFALTACNTAPKHDAAAQPVDAENDRCGASQYQSYIGKPLSSLDTVKFANPVRAIPHNSAVTMDFNLNRLNFMGDASGNISSVYCG
ncbi:I78 family peptidase inhibitor [Erwiniaceae bacterium BAC15a-03b]|uniref:I78 family peptidase inhibitor n=1 Tax=Winslowiella arboricola TaxID=2978220 RepID=A0A9J6PHI1_9GAMM|nr:I78 family peptidase inhibitor [Winslowiella arboricola]MCU5771201.1 I78 family peptidase inhibitor [Winslowiella arboricola]MCU5776166.1 I78 family peptidase inhibitor [Winslowiella arboricola]